MPMGIKVKNSLTFKRLAIVVAIVFVEAFIMPLNSILGQGLWPQPIQVVHCLTTALLQVTTLFLGLLEKS